MTRVGIVGAGASGLMAAITAAKNGADVCIYENKDKAGKKILATGNGRCNFTNTCQDPSFYRSENKEFPVNVLKKFDYKAVLDFFYDLGICTNDRNGYIYPKSDQAAAVLEVLLMEAKRVGVKIITDCKIAEIRKRKKEFKLINENGDVFRADKVILCAGSKASPVTGSDGSGYALAKSLGHSLIPVLPSLVQLRCKEKFYKKVSGVRVNGKVTLYVDNKEVASDTGEIQLTNYGISGIPVFQVSRYASIGLYKKKEVKAVINFMPDFSKDELNKFICDRISKRPEKTLDEFFTGIFNKKLSQLFVSILNLKENTKVSALKENDINRMDKLISSFTTVVTETNSFEQAQVCCGGINTKEIDNNTLESLYVKDLYFAGEIMDVDGICGGYNLQWAWSSGYTAGISASGKDNTYA